MGNTSKKLLVLNPGSTSTKLALFEGVTQTAKTELRIDEYRYKTPMVLEQFEDRMASLTEFLEANRIDPASFDMVVTRGPALWGLRSGAYAIDEHLIAVLRHAPRVQHAASIGSAMAYEFTMKYGIPAIFYDSASSDEAEEILHYTGIPELRRSVTCHTLNTKHVGHQVALEMGRKYEESTFIIAHMGGGITVGLHKNGKIVDTLSDDEGSMSPQRAGRIGTKYMIQLCYSGKYTKGQAMRMTRGKGGLSAYFGTDNMREIEKMIDEGNTLAKDLYGLMAYQLAQSIGSLAAACCGQVDGIILTGGLAYSERFTEAVSKRVRFIAPVHIVPGEQEMQALAEGAMRVLNGEEEAKPYRWLPEGVSDYHELLQGEPI